MKSNLQLYWFCFILLCNWSRKLACPLNQSDAKLKQILIFFASVIVSFFFSAEFLLAHCDIFLFPKYRIYSLMCPGGLSNVLNLESRGFLRRCAYSIFTIFTKYLVYLAIILLCTFFFWRGGGKRLVLVQSWVFFDLSYLQPGERLFEVDF